MSNALSKLRRLAGKASADYRLIQPGDHLLIGVSGGKDSLVLLKVLTEIKAKNPFPFSLTAATFDPGFSGFGAEETARYCESLGVSHHIIPFDMPALLKEKGNPASPCGSPSTQPRAFAPTTPNFGKAIKAMPSS